MNICPPASRWKKVRGFVVSAKRGLHLSIGAGPTEETVGVGAWVGVMVMVMIVVWTVAITLALAVVVWDAARGCGESEIVAGAVVPIFNIFNQTLTYSINILLYKYCNDCNTNTV